MSETGDRGSRSSAALQLRRSRPRSCWSEAWSIRARGVTPPCTHPGGRASPSWRRVHLHARRRSRQARGLRRPLIRRERARLSQQRPAELLDAYFAYVEAHRTPTGCTFRDTTHRDIQQQGTRMLATILAQQPSWEDAGAAELEMATEVMRTGLIGLALWWQEHPGVTRPAVVAAAMRALSMASPRAAS